MFVVKTYLLIMQINFKVEINNFLVGKCPVGISPKLGKIQTGMAVGKSPVGISPFGIAPDTLCTVYDCYGKCRHGKTIRTLQQNYLIKYKS